MQCADSRQGKVLICHNRYMSNFTYKACLYILSDKGVKVMSKSEYRRKARLSSLVLVDIKKELEDYAESYGLSLSALGGYIMLLLAHNDQQ